MTPEGESDLKLLLSSLSPVIAGQWAFVAVRETDQLDPDSLLMTFREPEGLTAIVAADQSAGLDVRFVGTCIDIRVHSSLSAVGLTAAISQALASLGIPANIVAAVYHDYVFVPTERAEGALTCLLELGQGL